MLGIVEILMKRDGMTLEQAEEHIERAKEDMQDRLAEGESVDDICEIWFGLEPDYIMQLI